MKRQPESIWYRQKRVSIVDTMYEGENGKSVVISTCKHGVEWEDGATEGFCRECVDEWKAEAERWRSMGERYTAPEIYDENDEPGTMRKRCDEFRERAERAEKALAELSRG